MEINVCHRGYLAIVITLNFFYFAKSRLWPVNETTQAIVPCFFILGDSLVDNGNNNNEDTVAKANYKPYGIDFPQGATGRFCNGQTIVDALAQLLGFSSFIPRYSTTNGTSLIKGVNFASAGAGIRHETGNQLGSLTTMTQQVNNFGVVVEEMKMTYYKGDTSALQNHMSKCMIYSGIGSNDYLNNYFLPTYNTSSEFTSTAYATALIQEYSHQLMKLYEYGARKVIVQGIGKMGCIPFELERFNGTNESICNEDKNNIVNLFNSGLEQLIESLNSDEKFSDAKFVYLDSFPFIEGMEVVDKACCGIGKKNGKATCIPNQIPCDNRNKYLFWDSFHPTEMANILFAKRAYNTKSKKYANPINIKDLAML